MASKIHLYALFFSFFVLGIHAITITVRNNCGQTIWPATQAQAGGPVASTTGFELTPQASRDIDVPPNWTAGRIWARTGCSDNGGKLTCTIGECGNGLECNGNGGNPPVSLAEFTLTGNANQDTFDISLVDGFNLPLNIAPSNGNCRTANCPANINDGCPGELAIPGGCRSACAVFNEDRYCCRGEFNSPQTCQPSDFSRYFKGKCADAYSYAYDDQTSTFTCSPGTNYVVTFCP